MKLQLQFMAKPIHDPSGQFILIARREALLFASAQKVTKNALLLIHKLKFEVVYAYDVAFLNTLFSQCINDTAGNKYSLEILQ